MIEAKVIASTVASFLVSTVVAWLNAVQDDPALLGEAMPTWLQTLLIALIPTVVTFLAGYQARHTPRSELP